MDEIWVDDRRIESLPADVAEGSTIVVGSGEAWVAVRPLARTHLSHLPPLRLVEHQGSLALEVYNYEGVAKTFWELGWPGSFYQGQPQCGFYAEVAERSAWADGAVFAAAIAGGVIEDHMQDRFTYEGDEQTCLWSVSYAREGSEVGLEVDLMQWQLQRRWNHDGELGLPMLESSVARQTRTGEVSVGEAKLSCGPAAAWLYAHPEGERWAAAYHGPQAAPLTLDLPRGKIEIEALSAGLVVWDRGEVTITSLGMKGTPMVTGGTEVRIR